MTINHNDICSLFYFCFIMSPCLFATLNLAHNELYDFGQLCSCIVVKAGSLEPNVIGQGQMYCFRHFHMY